MKTKLNTSRKSLDIIADRLWWIAVWLFVMSINSCAPNMHVVIDVDKLAAEDTEEPSLFEKFDSFFGFDGKGGGI